MYYFLPTTTKGVNPCAGVVCDENAVPAVINETCQCICLNGFIRIGDEGICQGVCAYGAVSITPTGLLSLPYTCTADVDECWIYLDNCDPNAACINTIGSFECMCCEGFEGDSFVCTRM